MNNYSQLLKLLLSALKPMLIGQYTSKLTDKDRLAVPKKFREGLGNELIVAKWYEGCLVVVSVDKWEEIKRSLVGRRGLITSPIRDIDRFILGSAFSVSLDRQGRFIIPDILRVYAEISDEVYFIGLEDRVEIWASDKWLEMQKHAEQKASAAIEQIAKTQKEVVLDD